MEGMQFKAGGWKNMRLYVTGSLKENKMHALHGGELVLEAVCTLQCVLCKHWWEQQFEKSRGIELSIWWYDCDLINMSYLFISSAAEACESNYIQLQHVRKLLPFSQCWMLLAKVCDFFQVRSSWILEMLMGLFIKWKRTKVLRPISNPLPGSPVNKQQHHLTSSQHISSHSIT